jgi:P2 family phage contractile tail tube protein
MSGEILVMETANVFIGNHDPEKSKHLVIKNLTLPTLEPATADHMPGGGVMEVAFSMGVLRKLEPSFQLVGFDQEAYRAAGVGSNQIENFTFRGGIRKKSDGRLLAAVATIRGTMGKVAPDQFERGNLMGHDHMLVDVVRYKLELGGVSWFDVDFWGSTRKRFGVDEYAEMRRVLGVL